jgi:two-component system response regulator FlrC|tara:strand:- start:5544 stop:6938 length:1395 start_codon:yes stop_codon:yes gene_type:complete
MTSTVIVWIDGSDKPSAIVEELSSSGLTIIQVTQDSLTDGDITKADAIVLCIDTDISSISEVQSRQARLNSTSPLIARVDRNNFELAIQVMRKGAATVVPSQQQDFTDWCETLSIVKVSKPMQQSSFVFADPVSRNLLALTERVAKVDVTVLLTGPTGSGKEVLAKILHDTSPRHGGPFIAFNCAAMPENLIEDMLFGHERGSFTGATKEQPGLFEQAQGGTVFLDEIGEMSFHLQAKLLRILQERNITRLGGRKPIDLDIRVVAATNRNLKTSIRERSFREDLYFRLSAFKITIPALKKRPMDILPLAEQFISQQKSIRPRVTLSEDAQQSLVEYHWPGNVRELQNVIMRALVLTPQSTIDSSHLIFDDITDLDDQDNANNGLVNLSDNRFSYTNNIIPSASQAEPLSKAVKSSEYQTIMTALQNSRSRDQAAEVLGISTRTLRHKLQRLREEGMSVTRAYAR